MDAFEKKIKKYFDDYVDRKKEINGELRAAVKRADMVSEFLRKMSDNLKRADDLQVLRRGKRFRDNTIKSVVEDFANVFLVGFEKIAEQRQMSEIERYKKAHEKDAQKEMDDALAGKNSGAFEDMGLYIPEEQRENNENTEIIKNKCMVDYGRKV